MIVFPNCKINIGLNIIRKREDGYHDLESVFYPVSLCDILEITESKKIEIINTGLKVDCPLEKNLCYKAYQLLKKDFDLPEIRIHLHKIIPFGAGLGGGSSDASFTLKAINDLFSLGISSTKLQSYAAQIGSDCAFFIENAPALAIGRGELLEPMELSLSSYKIVLVKPNIHISTAEAYGGVKPLTPDYSLKEMIKKPVQNWKGIIKNDFENHLFDKYPDLASIKEQLYNSGAIYASMSGSGSTIYGIFEKDLNTSKLNRICNGEIYEIENC